MSEANRRLAGILAADVVGYSAMVGTDEPGTLARVRALRTDLIDPLSAAHGGRLFKTTGDGFFVAFASAVQALQCAVAIQETLRTQADSLCLRIGVHQGEVVPEGDDLLGDSRPVVGSSSNSRSGSLTSARAIVSRRFMPPDRGSTLLDARSPSCTKSRSSVARVASTVLGMPK